MLLNSIFLKYQFSANSSIDSMQFQLKSQVFFFFFIVVNTNKTIPNFLWKSKGPKRAKPFWKIKIGGLTNFKSHYEPTVFKTM